MDCCTDISQTCPGISVASYCNLVGQTKSTLYCPDLHVDVGG